MQKSVSLALLALWAGSAATATPPAASGETAIPFISSLNSVEWKAVSNDSLYVRGGNGNWYFVRTSNRCTRLRQASGIGFQTSALDQLDRHGAILVEGVRCPVASVVRSDGPPRRKRSKAG